MILHHPISPQVVTFQTRFFRTALMQVPATISQNEGCEGERCNADSSVLLTIPRLLLGMGLNPIFSSGKIMKNLYVYIFSMEKCGFHRENLV